MLLKIRGKFALEWADEIWKCFATLEYEYVLPVSSTRH